jgi:hypothetical protein
VVLAGQVVLAGPVLRRLIQRVRRTALDALCPAPGQRLLDAGCGTGDVAPAGRLTIWVAAGTV